MNKKQKLILCLLAVSTLVLTSTTAIGVSTTNNMTIESLSLKFRVDPSELKMEGVRGGTSIGTFSVGIQGDEGDVGKKIHYEISITGEGPCKWKVTKDSGEIEIPPYNPNQWIDKKHTVIVSNLPNEKEKKVYGTVTVVATKNGVFFDSGQVQIEVETKGPKSKELNEPLPIQESFKLIPLIKSKLSLIDGFGGGFTFLKVKTVLDGMPAASMPSEFIIKYDDGREQTKRTFGIFPFFASAFCFVPNGDHTLYSPDRKNSVEANCNGGVLIKKLQV